MVLNKTKFKKTACAFRIFKIYELIHSVSQIDNYLTKILKCIFFPVNIHNFRIKIDKLKIIINNSRAVFFLKIVYVFFPLLLILK